ncbi:MAG: hypothetical protein OXE05_03185 [Chloroflexi bacterium]|nr:hypothetical protein [Chloroflexota bacterium]
MTLRPPRSYCLPKAGNRPDEYEDASRVVYPQRIGASGRRTVRVAVADGASESAFAREWANILTDAFVDRPLDLCGLTEESLYAWLAVAQAEWHAGVPWDRVPWHGEAKARAGAFATLLGLTVGTAPDDPRRLRWQAVAVGDSCLFIVRGGRLQLSFPLEDAAQFDNAPDLVCSNPANAGELWECVRRGSGQCAAGDLFILASDALACWFLSRNAAGEKPWETLLTLNASGWAAWVEEQRRGGAMRNDDTTAVVIAVA